MAAELINKIRYFQKLDSTMLEAKRCLTMKRKCPRIIMAREQSHGRGRYGRIWFAPKGNLYFNYIESITRPIDQQPIILAIAVARTLQRFINNAEVRVKHPNDVLVDGKKICGILVENLDPYYSSGIGINVRLAPLVHHYETTFVHQYNPYVTEVFLLRCFLKEYEQLSNLSFEEILKLN